MQRCVGLSVYMVCLIPLADCYIPEFDLRIDCYFRGFLSLLSPTPARRWYIAFPV